MVAVVEVVVVPFEDCYSNETCVHSVIFNEKREAEFKDAVVFFGGHTYKQRTTNNYATTTLSSTLFTIFLEDEVGDDSGDIGG